MSLAGLRTQVDKSANPGGGEPHPSDADEEDGPDHRKSKKDKKEKRKEKKNDKGRKKGEFQGEEEETFSFSLAVRLIR